MALGALYSAFIRSDIGLLGEYRNLLAKNQNMVWVNLRKRGTIFAGVETKNPRCAKHRGL